MGPEPADALVPPVDVGCDAPYRAPLAEFIPARNALVARLKAAGHRERLAVAKALVKPSATAWAVNQVHWQAPALLTALVCAGNALRQAQGSAHAEALRAAMAARREALSEARARALAFLSAGGHAVTPAVEQRVSDTLLALASHGEHLPASLRLGCLTQDLTPPGFEALAGLALTPVSSADAVTRAARVTVPPAPAVVQAVAPAPAVLVAAERALADAERDVAQAEREQRDAEAAGTLARQALTTAQAAEAALAAQLVELDARLAALRAQHDQACEARAHAQQALAQAVARGQNAHVAWEQRRARHTEAAAALAAWRDAAGDPTRP